MTDSGCNFKTLRAPTPQKISAFVAQLSLLGLAFDLDINALPSALIVTSFNAALLSHFNTYRLAFSSSAPLSSTSDTLQWTVYLTGKAQRVPHLGALLKVASSIPTNALTHT